MFSFLCDVCLYQSNIRVLVCCFFIACLQQTLWNCGCCKWSFELLFQAQLSVTVQKYVCLLSLLHQGYIVMQLLLPSTVLTRAGPDLSISVSRWTFKAWICLADFVSSLWFADLQAISCLISRYLWGFRECKGMFL